jgi:ABC-type branched-subunit amino acid transport system substrate-binding protein
LHRAKRWIVLAAVPALVAVAASCGGRDAEPTAGDTDAADTAPAESADGTSDSSGPDCSSEAPEATEVGVTEDTITIEVMADVGASTAPGLFQGNHDALSAFADYVNANGGIACRDLEVILWDTKLDADESLNGQIDACQNSLALVGSNALFNPDVSTMVECEDMAGEATGLPDLAALANDINQRCNATTYLIQGLSENCAELEGERTVSAFTGFNDYVMEEHGGDLHGLFMVPGDLPTTVVSATYQITAAEEAGVVWDDIARVSGRAEQAAFTPLVQQVKADDSNYVYNGSNDRAMAAMRKESAAQGVSSVDVWGCSLGCYTQNFLETAGSDAEDTYVWMQFLPFEEADTNDALAAYMDAVGADNADSFGAQAWQAALLFQHVIDQIVETDGINGITRQRMLEVLEQTDDFTAGEWMGTEGKDLRGFSTCMVILQVQDGEFVRVFPEERGTLDCDPANLGQFELDPDQRAEQIP